ncbi:MAG: RdgB/HAM1 family non-canonical purine NTP pyrophosphatase [Candidatus Kapaibacterium sp.]
MPRWPPESACSIFLDASPTRMTILIATNNRHKVEEMLHILQRADSSLVVLTPADLPQGSIDVDETGSTLEENAYLKARAFFEHTGIPCIADDTGLEIDALGGKPGVRSARFAHDNATYEENLLLALQMLSDTPPPHRTARFRTVMCYVDSLRTLFAEGECPGHISEEPRGSNGFGYDPVFVPDGYQTTFAQMTTEIKNSLSHRSRALQNMSAVLTHGVIEPASQNVAAPEPLRIATPAAPHAARRILCRIAAAAAANNEHALRSAITLAATHGVPMSDVYEVLLQSYLFAGFPAALESLNILDELRKSERASAPDSPSNGRQAFNFEYTYDADEFRTRGLETCKKIYTDVFEKMMQRLGDTSPELASWMIVEGYGKVLSRPELDVCTRELVNVAVLSVMGRPRQLYSHLRGALNTGAGETEITDALEAAMGLASSAALHSAFSTWDNIRERRQSS